MAKSSKEPRRNAKVVTDASARCLPVARRGIKSGAEFADFMSGLMSDLIEGKVSPQVANAACNAGGKLLKVVDLQYRYGAPARGGAGRRQLALTT